MLRGDGLQRGPDLLHRRLLDRAEKLERKMEILNLRPGDLHANVHLLEPCLRIVDGNAHPLREINGNEGADHFLRNSRRTTSSAYCETKNLNVSRSRARTWRWTSVRCGVANPM